MRLPRSLTLIVMTGFAGLIAAQAVGAEQREPIPADGTSDIVLADGGLLVGQVVNAQGRTMGNVVVSLRRHHQELARTTTKDSGRFGVRGLQTGTYQLVTRSGQRQVRAWAQSSAPPNAVEQALVVDGSTVRGQSWAESPVSEVPSSILLDTPDNLSPPDESLSVEEIPYTQDQTSYASNETDDVEQPVVETSPSVWSDAPYDGTTYGNGPPVRRRIVFSRPWLWGTGVAAAIALPIALDHDDDGDAS